jgi:CBS domain-containing protein
MLKASQIMTRDVVTVSPDATMGSALDLMLNAGVSGLVVSTLGRSRRCPVGCGPTLTIVGVDRRA